MQSSPTCSVTPRAGQIIKDIIEGLSFNFACALNDRDIEAALNFFAPDGVMIAPDRPGVCGKEAIRTLLEKMFESDSLAVNLVQSSVVQWGDLAIEIGAYSMQLTQPILGSWKDKGKFVTSWRRQANGEFLITVTVWTSNSQP